MKWVDDLKIIDKCPQQNVGFLSVWILIASYLRGLTIVCVIFVMIFVCLVWTLPPFNSVLKLDNIDAVLDGVPAGRRTDDSRAIFVTAVFTSWVSPCSVWTNNAMNRLAKRKVGLHDFCSHYLALAPSSENTPECFSLYRQEFHRCYPNDL